MVSSGRTVPMEEISALTKSVVAVLEVEQVVGIRLVHWASLLTAAWWPLSLTEEESLLVHVLAALR